MADIRLDRSDAQRLSGRPTIPKNTSDRASFYRIPGLCPGAMRFNDLGLTRVKTRASIYFSNERLLRDAAGQCNARRSAILVRPRAPNNRTDGIPIAQGRGQGL